MIDINNKELKDKELKQVSGGKMLIPEPDINCEDCLYSDIKDCLVYQRYGRCEKDQ